MRRATMLTLLVLLAAGEAAAVADAPTTVAVDAGPLRVVAFYSSVCENCERAKRALREAAHRWGDRVAVEHRDVREMHVFREMFVYEDHYGGEAQAPPKVYVGRQVVEGYGQIERTLLAVIEQELTAGAVTDRPPAKANAQAADGQDVVPVELVERFRGFSVGAVAAAGLLDGVNPCAFTTIVFMLSMLAYLGKSRRQLAVVGIGFTAAVFATYLLLGLAVLAVMENVKAFSVESGLARGLTAGVGVLALALAVWSLVDFLRYRRSKDTRRMTLGLPKSIKQRIHKVIRNGLSTRRLLAGSVTVGVAVALLESLCTGQVYLPIIVFVRQSPQLRPAATAYLVLYNVMFILPLVAVLILAYLGTSSDRLGQLMRRHLGAMKLTMAALFAALGALVLLTL